MYLYVLPVLVRELSFQQNFLDIMFHADFHNSDTVLQNKGNVNFEGNVARVMQSKYYIACGVLLPYAYTKAKLKVWFFLHYVRRANFLSTRLSQINEIRLWYWYKNQDARKLIYHIAFNLLVTVSHYPSYETEGTVVSQTLLY